MTGLKPESLVRCIALNTELVSAPYPPEGYDSYEFSSKVLKYLFSTYSSAKKWQGKFE